MSFSNTIRLTFNTSNNTTITTFATFEKNNNCCTLELEQFNFETFDVGYVLKTTKCTRLPEDLRPICDTEFQCSNNNFYLIPFSFNTPPTPYTPNTPFFIVRISKKGYIKIYSSTSGLIPAGENTFNRQSVTYKIKNEKCEKDICKKECVNFNFNLLDGNLFPLENDAIFTSPPANIDVCVDVTTYKCSNLVHVCIPTFQFSTTDYFSLIDPIGFFVFITGGALQTNAGYIKQKPIDNVIFVTPDGLFNVTIDVYGRITITYNNGIAGIIPVGTYTFLSTKITYFMECIKEDNVCESICDKSIADNFIIDDGFVNIPAITFPLLQESLLQTAHVNDFYDDIFVAAWNSNNGLWQSGNTTQASCFVRTSYVTKCGKFVDNPIINVSHTLTDNNPSATVLLTTAAAINRKDKKNIVVTFTTVDYSTGPFIYTMWSVYTKDCGINWSNPVAIFSTSVSIDPRGVVCDKNGNFIAIFNQRSVGIRIFSSPDYGATWNQILLINNISHNSFYYFVSSTAGNKFKDCNKSKASDDSEYGFFLVTNNADFITGNILPYMFFIKTNGFNAISTTYETLQFDVARFDGAFMPGIAVAESGKCFIPFNPGQIGINYYGATFAVKDSGSLDISKLHGQFTVTNLGQNFAAVGETPFNSGPGTERFVIYDDFRHGLYIFYVEHVTPFDPRTFLFMKVSLDDGVTWSRRYQVSDTEVNNRCYFSAQLNPITKSIIVTVYDARNSYTNKLLQYFRYYINHKKLNKIVRSNKKIRK
jgi:hypothetical protein